ARNSSSSGRGHGRRCSPCDAPDASDPGYSHECDHPVTDLPLSPCRNASTRLPLNADPLEPGSTPPDCCRSRNGRSERNKRANPAIPDLRGTKPPAPRTSSGIREPLWGWRPIRPGTTECREPCLQRHESAESSSHIESRPSDL